MLTRWSGQRRELDQGRSFRKKLRAGELDDKEIEIEMCADTGGMPLLEIPGMPGAQIGVINHSATFSARRSAGVPRRAA